MAEEIKQTDWQAVALQQSERLQQLEKAQKDTAIENALIAVLAPIPVHDPARPQLVALLKDQVQLTVDSAGRQVAVGPALKPLGDHIREIMRSEPYLHFLRAGNEGTPSGQPAAPALKRGEGTAGWLRGELPLGQAILAEHQSEQADQTARGLDNPNTNLRLAVGVTPKS